MDKVKRNKMKKYLIVNCCIIVLAFTVFVLLDKPSPEREVKYIRAVTIMHDIKTLKNVAIVNFGQFVYCDSDTGVFCKFISNNSRVSEKIKKELLSGNWILVTETSNDKVFKKNTNKIKVSYVEKTNQGDKYSILITDISSPKTRYWYKSKKYLQYMLDEV